MHHPAVKVNFGGKDGANDVYDAEMRANFDVNESSVLILWQYEPCFAWDQEVDICDVVSLEVDVVIGWVPLGLQQWTNPSNESWGSALECFDAFVSLLMDEQRHF